MNDKNWAPRHHVTEFEEIFDLCAPPAWHAQAKCRGMPARLFFPGPGESGNGSLSDPAKQVCESCPVRLECLEAGMGENFGTWGGLSEKQRRRLRASRRGGDSMGARSFENMAERSRLYRARLKAEAEAEASVWDDH